MLAVETRYNGYRFRSRTEARWAVFFDHAGLMYEYEREAFDLFGLYYLPDFYIYEHEGRGVHSCWVEVKGVEPTPEEKEKLRLLCDAFCCVGFLLVGQPRPDAPCYQYHPASHGKGVFERISQRSFMAAVDATEECFDAGRGKRFDRQDFTQEGSVGRRRNPPLIRLDAVVKLKNNAELYEEALDDFRRAQSEITRLREELKQLTNSNGLFQLAAGILIVAVLLLLLLYLLA